VYGRSLDVRASTGSTNDDAREAAAAGAPRGHVVVADAQDRGRGSHGRAWSSPSGVDLYLSIVERLTLPPAVVPLVTLAVGVGVADAIAILAPELAPHVRVKWPNDAWIDRKKTAGILVESSSVGGVQGPLILGVGLGVNRLAWDGELAASATSLLASLRARDPARPALDRAEVLATLLHGIERAVDTLAIEGPHAIVQRLASRLAMVGERVAIDETEGTLVGVAESGAIRLAIDGHERTFFAGQLRPL
jgi:BirA family biotin operon repressor/biotin-[acetyl-CoA-carboxylase] ligase